MKTSFRVLLIVGVVLAIALIAGFTVPIRHDVTWKQFADFEISTTYDRYIDGVYENTYAVSHLSERPKNTTFFTRTIEWNYPGYPTFDFSWVH